MTTQKKIQTLKECFNNTIWMAIRYAHGRHTYAPSEVREAIQEFQKVFPDWIPKHDPTLRTPEQNEIGGFKLKEDYLNDLFDNNAPPQ